MDRFDLLLDWISESGSGTWDAFKQAHEWLRRAGLWSSPMGPSWAARTLATLGHLEIDWLNRSWAAAPTILTILPDAGAHALLSGSRTRELWMRLIRAVEQHDDVWLHEHPQPGAPRAVFFQIASEAVVEGLAEELAIRYDYSVAGRVAHLLPSLESYIEIAKALPAPQGEEAERFDVSQLTWLPAVQTAGPGTYRFKVFGRPEYRYIGPTGGIHRMDQDLSVYALLRDKGRGVLRWELDSVNGTLVVLQGAALPPLHARAAVLCTGLAPSFDTRERCWRYLNVPLTIAERIARSLGQVLQLKEEEQPSTGIRAKTRSTRTQPWPQH